MTVEIVQETDFSLIEDAIEDFILSGSGLPTDIQRVFWSGNDFDRKKPYAVIAPISQPTQGHPWKRFERVTESTVQKRKNTYHQPFQWNVQIKFLTDSYEVDGRNKNPIRMVAYRYAQNLLNRAFLPPVKQILEALEIAYNPTSEVITPNVLPLMDDDKYIHQAIVEFAFSGMAKTATKDTDYFTTIKDPTLYIEGEA